MKCCGPVVLAAFAATHVFGHGVITEIQGANKVTMPGLSVQDGTPRDCPSPLCGSEADTSIIRTREMGTSRASALGRTQGDGPVSADKMMAVFMNIAAVNSTEVKVRDCWFLYGATDSWLTYRKAARELHMASKARYAKLSIRAENGGLRTPKGSVETGKKTPPLGAFPCNLLVLNAVAPAVKAATGGGADGLPTCADDGTISMTFHQVNQDGAGPLTAMIDATSGGTDVDAFKPATVTQNVPGLGIGGLSAAQVMDFPVAVQMPQGMTCQGTVGDVQNVCIVRLNNAALAGPFGGSAAFTQSPAAKKRAIEFNLAKRRFARGL